ncbi:zinc ribbon domain-containing protein [Clostridium coskatii]|uniref:Putative zinc-ribbon domain-containing protein n=1 Tax=Clostridium coskatii TaxID=1705578 RepID=A0A162LFY4_9CLOT|nr:zinc ribbon domain-containing protein [Clostridium coskatii]OAA92986.1 hypothetical protein WX73_00304 [Clostridium coskatii]OBR90472.1 hypothetical protein CLCOS_40300 [Clostridium coskatii]
MENNKMTTCKACGEQIAKGAKKCPHCGKDQRIFFMKHKIISVVIVVIILGCIGSALGGSKQSNTSNNATSSTKTSNSKNTSQPSTKQQEVKQRQVQGKATDLGAGTFTVGKDIEEGLYDATPVDGSGNFIIQNASEPTLTVNEVLGSADNMGVPKVRVKLVKDEQIQLESINKTHFEPVTAAFVTEYKATSLCSGRWVVGEDIGSGRYVVTPKSGAGNFIVYKDGSPEVNEVLGQGGVQQVTANLNEGDIITIMSLNQVDFQPQK